MLLWHLRAQHPAGRYVLESVGESSLGACCTWSVGRGLESSSSVAADRIARGCRVGDLSPELARSHGMCAAGARSAA